MDPRQDIYTLWEIMHDGSDPVAAQMPLPVRKDVNAVMKQLIWGCVVEDPARRPSLADVYATLCRHVICGCYNE